MTNPEPTPRNPSRDRNDHDEQAELQAAELQAAQTLGHQLGREHARRPGAPPTLELRHCPNCRLQHLPPRCPVCSNLRRLDRAEITDEERITLHQHVEQTEKAWLRAYLEGYAHQVNQPRQHTYCRDHHTYFCPCVAAWLHKRPSRHAWPPWQ